MSAKDAVIAREQARRRPLPFEQSIHKRKPKAVKAVEPVEIIEEPTVDEAETLSTGEDIVE